MGDLTREIATGRAVGARVDDWLVGGGELGERIRAHDWATTPLGPRARWPAELRTAVRLLVDCPWPMVLAWGAERRLIYNDACRALVAAAHPRALGQPIAAVWGNDGPGGAPLAAPRPAFASASDCLSIVVERDGQPTTAWFARAHTPVRGDDGAVGGVLIALHEVDTATHLAAEEAAACREREHRVIADLLGVVAHDLRSPLHAIALQAALLRPARGQPERRARRPVEAIDRNIARMNRLIEDLLDLARLDAGPLPIARERVAVGELITDAVELHHDAAAAAATTLRWESDPRLPEAWVDRGRMLQVLDNLISNALRFAPGGTVSIGARADAGADVVVFQVVDDGAGIAPADVPHLFNRFWRSNPAAGHGAGLGLAIVKGIVEAHGGRVWVESSPGAGATFRFTAPAAVPSTARST